LIDNIDYNKTMNAYNRKMQRYESAVESWEENNLKDYSLVLQHCPAKLEAELWNQDAWTGVEDAKSVVEVRILIHDLQYNNTDIKQSIMATVEADFNLYACVQNDGQTTGYYHKGLPQQWTPSAQTGACQAFTRRYMGSTSYRQQSRRG
jgi:hypothetical protein